MNERAYSLDQQFTEFALAETNQLCGINSNVILMRQIRGYCASRVAGIKRRPEFYLPVRIWCVVSKCRRESDLGLCKTLVLAKRMRLGSADFRPNLLPSTFVDRESALPSRILFSSTEVMHRPRSDSPLHFDTKNTYPILMDE